MGGMSSHGGDWAGTGVKAAATGRHRHGTDTGEDSESLADFRVTEYSEPPSDIIAAFKVPGDGEPPRGRATPPGYTVWKKLLST